MFEEHRTLSTPSDEEQDSLAVAASRDEEAQVA